MQEGNLVVGGDGICDFMYGVGVQDNVFGFCLLQFDCGFSKDFFGVILVVGGLVGFDVVKIDVVQYQVGRVQVVQLCFNVFID